MENNIEERDNEITWEVRPIKQGSKQTISVHGMRTSRKKLEANLSDRQKDAAREISIAYDLLAKGMGYALLGMKVSNPHRVRGGEMSEDMIDSIREKLGKLHAWEFHTKKHYRQAVQAIEEMGLTAREYAERLNLQDSGASVSTITRWYRRGLQDYVILQGWEV